MCIFQHILIHSDQHEEVRNQLIDEVNQELAMEVLFDITLNDGKYEEEGDPIILPMDVERTDIFPTHWSEQNKECLEVI